MGSVESVRERIRELEADGPTYRPMADALERDAYHDRAVEWCSELAELYAAIGAEGQVAEYRERAGHHRRWANQWREEEGKPIVTVGPTYVGRDGSRSTASIRVVRQRPPASTPRPRPRFLPRRFGVARRSTSRRRRSGVVRSSHGPPGRSTNDDDPDGLADYSARHAATKSRNACTSSIQACSSASSLKSHARPELLAGGAL